MPRKAAVKIIKKIAKQGKKKAPRVPVSTLPTLMSRRMTSNITMPPSTGVAGDFGFQMRQSNIRPSVGPSASTAGMQGRTPMYQTNPFNAQQTVPYENARVAFNPRPNPNADTAQPTYSALFGAQERAQVTAEGATLSPMNPRRLFRIDEDEVGLARQAVSLHQTPSSARHSPSRLPVTPRLNTQGNNGTLSGNYQIQVVPQSPFNDPLNPFNPFATPTTMPVLNSQTATGTHPSSGPAPMAGLFGAGQNLFNTASPQKPQPTPTPTPSMAPRSLQFGLSIQQQQLGLLGLPEPAPTPVRPTGGTGQLQQSMPPPAEFL
jgi:hypothetical protein